MQRAIAVGGRACQAAVVVFVHLLPGAAAYGQISTSPEGTYFEARTPDGVLVRESCLGSPPAGRGESPCGTQAKKAVDVITRMSVLAGPFPQKTLTLVPSPLPRWPRLAISKPGEIRANESLFRFGDNDALAPYALPRAIADQWFFSELLPKAGDAWLKSALSEYLAWRYLHETSPEAAQVVVSEAVRDSVADAALWPLMQRVTPSESRTAQESSAGRGMLVLRTLETVIDRERVDRVLPEMMHRAAGRPPSTALLETVCEEIAGRKLEWFFDYFIQGTQIPVIELRRVPSESPGIVAGEIVVRDFPAEGSVRVEMSVRTAQGTVEHSVATRGAVTPFTVNVPAPALGITLDPDLRILRWTEAARRSKEQSALLAALPDPITAKNLPAAIELYRRALAADPDDAARRAQALHERLGELEWAHDEWNAALADLDPAINGHSISPFETYLCRAKGYLYHGVVQLHERRPAEAQKDARAGLALPRAVLLQLVPREPIESRGDWNLERLLETLSDAASRY